MKPNQPTLKVAIALIAVAFFVLCMSRCKESHQGYVKTRTVRTVMA